MIRFNNDYSEGAHPSVLERLVDTNMIQTPGYGEDEYCILAADIIKDLCGSEDLDVHFLVGGTQTNLTLISAALRPHQCAVFMNTNHDEMGGKMVI
jgi:threonine aldolase